MLGAAWIDEAAHFKSPPSKLHAALRGQVGWSKEDPSCKKLLRWQLEHRREEDDDQSVWHDELHNAWVDELSRTAAVPVADYDTLNDDGACEGRIDDDTEESVRKFLSGRMQQGSCGGSSSGDRTSPSIPLPPKAEARFRTAATSGRSDEKEAADVP